jgi:surface antigen
MSSCASLHARLCARILGLAIASAPTVVPAQPIVLPEVAWPGLSQDDISHMHAAAARLYEGKSVGTMERWRSPNSKDTGEVRLIRSFEAHGMPCRTIDYTIRYEVTADNPDHYVLNWCRVSEDTWKIVELAGSN